MRIICPDCEARYEVPDDVIPAEGRDVQCSDCGTTWFFTPPDTSRPQDAEAGGDAGIDAPESLSGNDDGDESPAPAPRRELDPTVAEILRAEAAREAAARAQDPAPEPLEYQPDLGLGPGGRTPGRPSASPEDGGGEEAVQESLRGEPLRAPVPTSVAGSRRDRLPDIEEVSSNLGSDRESGAHRKSENVPEAGRRRGFRGGFLLAILLFGALVGVYSYSAEIAQAVPDVDPWISNYVTWVDRMRTGLDAGAAMFMDWLDARIAAVTE